MARRADLEFGARSGPAGGVLREGSAYSGMGILDRHPSWRWAAPVAALAVVGSTAAVWPRAADASPTLPPITAKQLLVDLQQAAPTPLSGEVSQTLALGLPELPAGMGGRAANADLTSLVSGTHAWRVWVAGPAKSRLALLGQASESDIVRNGSNVWVWSSSEKSARHYVLPSVAATSGTDRAAKAQFRAKARAAQSQLNAAGLPDLTDPQAAADWALTQLDPSTTVSASSTSTVAGRSAYDLTLTPKAGAATRVARVVLSIDAEKHLPLAVRVYSTQQSAPAVDVAFSSVSFAPPDDAVFAFTPPPGASVETTNLADVATREQAGGHTAKATTPHPMKQKAANPAPRIVGSGWASVATGRMPAGMLTTGPAAQRGASPQNATPASDLLELLPKASGTWGSGHVLDGTLFSAVLTTDGRYAVGAVAPSALYAALPQR